MSSPSSSSLPSPFRPEDLRSGNGFLTYFWGPMFWTTVHTISLNYPCQPTATQRRQYKQFFDSLRHVLPCGKCRDNLVSNLETTRYGREVFQNRDTLSRWVYDLHACVNKMLGKQTKMTYTEMRHMYENFRARCSLQDSSHESRDGEQVGGGKRRRRRGRRGPPRAPQTPREGGCTIPLRGIKSQCLIRIVPMTRATSRRRTLIVDKRCLSRRASR